ncbi:cell division protein FtsK [bacterium]|nr:cell division protein FtsK [bacterium]|tara:strand:- start:5969 stop:8251 length:2283 start_codon:yes stop_codon:yes gene_type:complete
MTRKYKKRRGKSSFLPALKEETRRFIFSILSFVIAIFFLLAYANQAGIVGESIRNIFNKFFGVGYFLFPAFLVGAGIVFLSIKRTHIAAATFLGGLLFLTSGLALISTFNSEAGGIVGAILSSPFVALFDTFATKVILIALLFVSLLILFDATPTKIISSLSELANWLKNLVSRKQESLDSDEYEEDEDGEEGEYDDEEYDEEDEIEAQDESEGETTHKEDAEKRTAPFAQTLSQTKENILSFVQATSKEYTPPPLSLFETDKGKPDVGDIKANANIIKRTLQHFGINVEMDEVSIGPSITRYALKPAQGVKLSRIIGLQNDLSLALAAHPLRIEAPIPGRSLVGIEIPNNKKTIVGLGSLLKSPEIKKTSAPLAFPIGRSITGNPIVGNLNKMPHLLIAGATGAGKSVSLHTIITSLLHRNAPTNLRIIMVDPKRVELTLYNNIPHLLTPVITDPKKAILALKWAGKEMDRRYDVLEAESVRDIASYHKNVVEPAYAEQAQNKRGTSAAEQEQEQEVNPLPETMPYIVVIIDELADIMNLYPRELESAIVRIAQMARAVGIHLILSTQRPQVNIITGLIKANIPTRIALQVASQTDSRTILDMGGAEKLLGSGDLLYLSSEMSKPVRLQSAYIGESEIKKITKFLAKQNKDGKFDVDVHINSPKKDVLFEANLEENLEDKEGTEEDELYEDAREIVIQSKKASTTYLQRKLRIGYARAASIMDMLEERDVVGPAEGSKQREVLISAGEETDYDDENESI